jgi:hypothetical protein
MEIKRALTARDIINMQHSTFSMSGAWESFIGHPEKVGVWFIWGNSGNGKSSFAMQLCRELCRYESVLYNSLEEGTSLTMQLSLQRNGMANTERKFHMVSESLDVLNARLSKRGAPRVVVIDSFQYTQMSYKDYLAFRHRHKDRLLIFISHAEGKQPMGQAARSVMYDATLKIWVEGYKAMSKGRFIGDRGEYVIWEAGAKKYWGM